jgi:site-specific recombinase XerD
LGPNDGLSFSALSTKLAVLLALSSLCRVSELASIVKDSIVIDDEQAKFSLSVPRKSQRASALQVITLKKLLPVSLACPVEALKQYLSVSEPFRVGAKGRLLLLGLRPPRCSVSGSTVARWIKSILSEAGVDTTIYSAHSTRGASASNAANRGVPTDAILSAGCWKSESTFTRFYRRSTVGVSVASALHMGR